MFPVLKHYFMTTFLDAGDVWFSLRNTTYQNNSLVTLEDIGEDGDALLCKTDLTACCRSPYTGASGPGIGEWFFPNGTEVRGTGKEWNLYRSRKNMSVLLSRRRDGEDGIYRCEIPDSTNVMQTIYIGVYNTSTGEGHFLYNLVLYNSQKRFRHKE